MSVIKLAMNTGVENATQMTDMMKNMSLEPNLGQRRYQSLMKMGGKLSNLFLF